MAARLTDKQKKKIVVDYLELQSVNAAAKKNGVSWDTVRKILEESGDIEKKLEKKKEENTKDIIAYMEGEREKVTQIISLYLDELLDVKQFRNLSPSQLTTALGTLIDKWTAIGGGTVNEVREDGLSKSLKEMAGELESDD